MKTITIICMCLSIVLGCSSIARAQRTPAESSPPPTSITQQRETEPRTLTQVWLAEGEWKSAACDPKSGRVYALNSAGTVVQFDAAGKALDNIQLALPAEEIPIDVPTTLRLANLVGDEEPEFLLRYKFGRKLGAFDRGGKKLWEYQGRIYVSEFFAAHPPGAPDGGLGRIVLAAGNLAVLNREGTLLWERESPCWQISAEVTETGELQIMEVSGDGKACFFDITGKKLPSSTSFSRRVLISKPNCVSSLVAITSGSNERELAIRRSSGDVLLTMTQSASWGAVFEATRATYAPFLALGFAGGLAVYDLNSGELQASLKTYPRVFEWAPVSKDGTPRLIVIDTGLRMFELRASNTNPPSTEARKP